MTEQPPVPFTRRRGLRWLLGGAVAAGVGLALTSRSSPSTETPMPTSRPAGRLPSLFLAHGAPMLLDDAGWMAELAAWAKALPRPTSVLMLSAHWEERPLTLGATTTVPLVYDFSGFPERYSQWKYPAPGAPALAQRVRALLERSQPVAQDARRGLDHGAWVPLVGMYPDADVPVLQASLPTLEPRALFALGRALAPLRDEGVLIIGSGFLTHNMRAADFGPAPVTPSWAQEFDTFVEEALAKNDVDALLDYRTRAPGVRMALPTHEHFVPLLVALGAAADEQPQFPITGFWGGSFTRRSVQLG